MSDSGEDRRVKRVVCGTQKLSDETHFQECETRHGRSRNGDVQRLHADDEKGEKSQQGEVVGVYGGWRSSKYEREKCQRKVSQKVWHRGKLPLCQESAGLDDEFQCGISFSTDGNEFCFDEHLAAITRKMDAKKTSWSEKLEIRELSAEKIREFPEKSDRKSLRISQRNRNAELILTKFGSTEARLCPF